MIERLRGRSAFARLRADGVRVDDGLLWVRFLADSSARAAHVAFALPRQTGSAVIRNKIRRRLRAAVRSLDRESPGGLPAGLYLVGTRRGSRQCSYADLRVSLATCVAKLERTGL
ncbi:ribonuclease P protein component [Candidatus Poriferisocius sp.]|uniref:ribonuclease P protein component n=1 Tax=Candidatus Poriferisocius sp. TaxID=3101276 RepID=UPI003B02AF72